MKKFFIPVGIIFLFFFLSCKKTSYIDSPDALLTLSEDTLHFDTVFTSAGSVTQLFKIFNHNDQRLRLSEVRLMGGPSSSFKINVDGSPGATFSNLELEANDSMYVFVTVTINPSAANLPFIVRDSILISYNGNNQFLQLVAFGQNANFLKGVRITIDSTWSNDLPFVILDRLTVDSGVTLTINKGCKIYHHANAPFLVNGSLHINGDSLARVEFTGDRLDPVYKDLPGSWPGIFFTHSSDNNILNYTTIKNGYQGIIAESANGSSILTLNQCIIDNILDAGILSEGSSISATNCQISNCGSNIFLSGGGNYSFNHCTVVTYGNLYIDHKSPVLYITNKDILGTVFPLSADFSNCIFYGDGGSVENEIIVDNNIPAGQVNLSHILYKNKNAISYATNSILNQDPQFVKTDAGRREFDFHLKPTSPAINAAQSSVIIDLDGKPRPVGSSGDIGCFEFQ